MFPYKTLLREIQEKRTRVLVVGLGLSGIEAALALHRVGVQTRCIDSNSEQVFRERGQYCSSVEQLIEAGAEIVYGVKDLEYSTHLDGVDLVVVSPGVPLDGSLMAQVKSIGMKVVSELELGIGLLNTPSIVVTGSNGKSTVVSLIHHILDSSGVRSFLCGNVGIAVCSGVSEDALLEGYRSPYDFLVVEASSYQIESSTALVPHIGILLNISENHLERHGTLKNYLAAKAKLFMHQRADDFAVINADDDHVATLEETLEATICSFGLKSRVVGTGPRATIDYRPRVKSDSIAVDFGVAAGGSEDYELSGNPLIGVHNRYNLAAAILVARISGVSPDDVQRACSNFVPLPHRLEALLSAPLVINDSKSTTVASTIAAVSAVRENCPERRLLLLLGGRAKQGEWDGLMRLLQAEREAVRTVVCFGQDGDHLFEECERYAVPSRVFTGLEEAASYALENALADELVLLSPGCASFDQFTDFEERGNVFKSLVSQRM